MTAKQSHVRHGIGAVRPYVHGPVELLDFVRKTFGAVELERHEFGPENFHVELRIGDSVIVIEAGELPPGIAPWTCSIYVYVENVDDVYDRAIGFGAKSLSEVQDKPYQERQAGFTDIAGNTWWIASFKPPT